MKKLLDNVSIAPIESDFSDIISKLRAANQPRISVKQSLIIETLPIFAINSRLNGPIYLKISDYCNKKDASPTRQEVGCVNRKEEYNGKFISKTGR